MSQRTLNGHKIFYFSTYLLYPMRESTYILFLYNLYEFTFLLKHLSGKHDTDLKCKVAIIFLRSNIKMINLNNLYNFIFLFIFCMMQFSRKYYQLKYFYIK